MLIALCHVLTVFFSLVIAARDKNRDVVSDFILNFNRKGKLLICLTKASKFQ